MGTGASRLCPKGDGGSKGGNKTIDADGAACPCLGSGKAILRWSGDSYSICGTRADGQLLLRKTSFPAKKEPPGQGALGWTATGRCEQTVTDSPLLPHAPQTAR